MFEYSTIMQEDKKQNNINCLAYFIAIQLEGKNRA